MKIISLRWYGAFYAYLSLLILACLVHYPAWALDASLDATQSQRHVVLVDAGVEDYEHLLGVNPTYKVIYLGRSRTPLAAIADALQNLGTVDSLHILSHGEDGALSLGGQWVTQGSLEQNREALQSLRRSLGERGQIYLYGCNVAATERGRSFVDTLAAMTGAGIAASNDATGHADLSGDWELEYRVGEPADMGMLAKFNTAQYRYTLSHFRGGSITWQAVELDSDGLKNDVQITVKTAWRYNSINAASLSSVPSISTSQISDEILYVNGDASGADYALRTTIFEARDLDSSTNYIVRYTGCCRIGGLQNNAGGDWDIQTEIFMQDGNLAPKIDLPIIFEVPQLQSDGVTALDDWSFDLGSTDPNADKLRYRLANLVELGGDASINPAGISINPNTGLVTWTGSGALTSGLYSAGFVAEDLDSSGNTKSKTHVDVIFDLQNKASVAYTPSANVPETSNVIVEKGSTFSFSVSGAAIETSSLGSLQGALTEPTDNNFLFDPGAVGTGLVPATYPITFEVNDTSGTYGKSYLVINFIVPDPDAPMIANLEADRVTYSSTVSQLVDDGLDAVLTDADDTHFNGGFLKFNVTFTDGEYEVLDVNSVGDGAGEIRRTGTELFYEGTKFGEVDSTEDGVGTALRIDFTSADATVAAVQALIRSLSYEDTFTLRAAGDRSLSLYIQDPAGNSNSYNFYVDVQDHPSKPAAGGGPVEAANTLTIVEGQTIALSNENINYADPDTGDTITLTVSGVSNGQFELVGAPGVAITSFTQAQVNLGAVAFAHDGSAQAPAYSVSASDGTNPVTAPSAATVSFSTAPDAPTLTGSPGATATENESYSFTPTVVDDDLGDSHSFNISNKPSWATFDTETGELSGTPGPSDVGITSSNILITVTDSTARNGSLASFSIQVARATDTDGDGVPDYEEIGGASATDPNDAENFIDTDGDGVPDYVETYIYGSDPNTPDAADGDGDGVPDYQETYVDGSNPADAASFVDSDGDGTPDYIETNDDGTDPSDASSFADSDGDGSSDYHEEQVDGTDPADANSYVDSDGDGVTDYLEGLDGTDPNDALSVRAGTALVMATGLFTPVSQADLVAWDLMGAEDSCCGDHPLSEAGEPMFAPGRHLVSWAGDGYNVLMVQPIVSLGQDQSVSEGASASFTLWLNGPAPVYPLTVEYSVSGSADGADHDLVSGSAVFTSNSTEVAVSFSVADGDGVEGDETVIVTLSDSADNPGSRSTQTFTIVEANAAPQVSLALSQGGGSTLVVSQGGGDVLVVATVVDPNSGDSHSYNWQPSSPQLSDTDLDDSTFTFDPSGLDEGVYKVSLVVADDGAPSASAKASVYVQVVASLPSLGAGDADGDGVDDQTEGLGDSDGDGIADYLDGNDSSSLLPEQLNDDNAFMIECAAGTRCRRGGIAMVAVSGGAQVTDADISASAEISSDQGYVFDGGIFDFEIVLPQAGQSVLVVIPQRAPIPAAANYRKFAPGYGWGNFVEDANNAVYSAPGEAGYCPEPGAEAWESGLQRGYWCVQLKLQDGGANDADGEANGLVVDPGGVGMSSLVGSSLQTVGGGAVGLPLLLLAMLGALCRMVQWRMLLLIAFGLYSLSLRAEGVVDETVEAQAAPLPRIELSVSPVAIDSAVLGRSGWRDRVYFSSGTGYARTGFTRAEMESSMAGAGISADVSAVDGSRAAWDLGFGYRISAHWALELSYVDLGELDIDFTISSPATDLSEIHPESGDGAALSGLYQYNLHPKAGLRARLGIFDWSGHYKTRRDGSSKVDEDGDSGTDLYWGLGTVHPIHPQWALTTEFQHFEFDRQDTDYFRLGLQWRMP